MVIAAFISPRVEVPAWLFNPLFSTNRWLHLVASTLLIGGVLFFVFVVPVAASDLKVEHQLAVFGKARWMFRKIVGWSLVALLITGVLSLWRIWAIYKADQAAAQVPLAAPGVWAWAHIIVAVIGAIILVRVTATRNILGHPIPWLWVALALLLVGMLLASVARQMLLDHDDRRLPQTVYLSPR